jgi:Ca2+-binding RTX toxin-like protein
VFTTKTLTVAEYNCELKPFHPAVKVTIADTSVALQTLDFANLKNTRVDRIDATDGVLALSVAQYQALKSVKLAADDVVTLLDAGQTIACLTLSEIQALASKGIDIIDASDDALTLSVEQLTALGTVALSGGDTVTLRDTGAALAGLTMEQILALTNKGIDAINVIGSVALTVAQATALVAAGLTFTSGSDVSVVDTGAALSSLTAEQIAALADNRIDAFDASDNTLTLSLEQLKALGTVTLTDDDRVTLSDTGAAVSSLSPYELTALGSKGVDVVDVSGPLTLTVAQAVALAAASITFADGDVVTVADTGAALATLTAEQKAALAAVGMTFASVGNIPLVLTVAQYRALGTAMPAAEGGVVLEDTGMALASLTVDEMGSLAGNRVTTINALDDALSLSVAQFEALGAVTLAGDDVITLQSNLSYALPDHVSHLELKDAAVTGTGNSLGNFLSGNDADNVLFGMSGDDALFGGSGNDRLNGGTGIDWMEGGAGNDTYYVDRAGDKVKETSFGGTADRVYTTVSYTLAAYVENLYSSGTASISLTGTTKNNTIYGNSGANKIKGGYGNDILKGGLDKDAFIFNTKLSSKSNLDRITDFNVKDDSLYLDNPIFKKLGSGSMSSPKKLSSSFFTVGDKAKDGNDYVIYNKTTGILSYDADGSGSGGAVAVAKLPKNLAMTSSDIYII